MNNINAYVLTGAGAGDVAKWLTDYAGTTIVNKLRDCNLLVFTGGADVTPGLYGEENVNAMTDYRRDREELELFQFAQAAGIPMLGICRGSQFLHVCMGGSLWQDVTDHCCQHSLRDLETDDIIDDTTSTHHQMVRMKWDNYDGPDAAGFTLVAVPDENRSKHYQCGDGFYERNHAVLNEVEVYRYDRDGTSIMGVQGHPEWSTPEFASWAAGKVLRWHRGIEREPNIEELAMLPLVVERRGGDEPFDREAYQREIAAL